MRPRAWLAAWVIPAAAAGLNMFGGRGFLRGRQGSVEVTAEVASWETLSGEGAVASGAALATGPASVRAAVRTFGEAGAPKVRLYRDSAAWCPYCHKTLLLLEERALPYQVEKINMACYGDKPRRFFEVQPSGTLPAAEFEGRVLRSSDAIMLATLDADGGVARRELDARDDPRCGALLDLERAHFSAWLRWLTGGDAGRGAFEATLDRVEASLSEGPYFLGRRFSVVDVAFAPFLERMVASLAYFKGFVVRSASPVLGDDDLDAWTRYPNLNRWFEAMETRDPYRATKGDWYTHAHDLPPQLGGCVAARTPAAEAVRADVDGGAWLDSPPKFEHLWPWIADPSAEAADALAANGPNVAAFAARGAAPAGFPPFRAPLADPNARPDDRLLPVVDALLRQATRNLRAADDHFDYGPLLQTLDDPDRADLARCFRYLRDRVGVPRDMSFPAARALRVECNRVLAHL